MLEGIVSTPTPPPPPPPLQVGMISQQDPYIHCKNVWITSTCFGYLSCIEQQIICNSDAQIGSKSFLQCTCRGMAYSNTAHKAHLVRYWIIDYTWRKTAWARQGQKTCYIRRRAATLTVENGEVFAERRGRKLKVITTVADQNRILVL